jgi:hypothetical protein
MHSEAQTQLYLQINQSYSRRYLRAEKQDLLGRGEQYSPKDETVSPKETTSQWG